LEKKVEEMQDEVEGCDIDVLVENVELCNKRGLISLKDEYLCLHYQVWCEVLFDKIVNPIVDHIEYLLNNTVMKEQCKYLCIVGGLGSSKYLQYRLHKAFGEHSKYHLTLVVPARPILSVVDGAARFGLQPDYIQARTLMKTYGNAIDPKIDAINIEEFDDEYVNNNRYLCDHTNVQRLRNVFSIYAKKKSNYKYSRQTNYS